MKILYGVLGEGMGHATRSSVILEHLSQHHEVEVVATRTAYDFLSPRFDNVHRIWGLGAIYRDNALNKRATLWHNLRGLARGLPLNLKQYLRLRRFRPDVVITDFESWSYAFGKRFGVPVISLDNIQSLTRCHHDDALLQGRSGDFRLARGVARSKTPGCFHYLVSTFYDCQAIDPTRTTLVPPIVRKDITELTPTNGDHILVYASGAAQSHGNLTPVLSQFPDQEFIVYGVRRDIDAPLRQGNVLHKPASLSTFAHDLASAKGVLANAGFSLISEALYLRKPYLALPIQGQFEQTLNARYLERMGLGLNAEQGLEPVHIARFLGGLPSFRKALAARPRSSNRRLFAHLEELFDQIEAGLGRSWRARLHNALVQPRLGAA